jgi:hypothetical protein
VQALFSKEVQSKVWEGCLRECVLDQLVGQQKEDNTKIFTENFTQKSSEDSGTKNHSEIFSENRSKKSSEKSSEKISQKIFSRNVVAGSSARRFGHSHGDK